MDDRTVGVPGQLPRGLSTDEARAILADVGPNTLPRPKPRSWIAVLAGELVHFFAALLWLAGGLAIVGGLPELGVAIFAVVVLNGVFAFVQERRADDATAALRDLVPRRAVVVRDGEPLDVDAAELVPGDLVRLEGGDRISADQRLVSAADVAVDESILTGESEPVPYREGELLRAGTFVVEGEGFALVERTGSATSLGQLAALTQTVERPATPMARELHRLVRTIAVLAVGAGATFFGAAMALGTAPSDGFVFAIGVTVALVPEGLLPTVTLSLAVAARRMADRRALVRHLESVETLGSCTFICTDKTGTLTQNRMNVVELWTPSGTVRVTGVGYEPTAVLDGTDEAIAAASSVAVIARRCSTGRAVLRDRAWIAQGDPMEAAIDALVHRFAADVDSAAAGDPERARHAFDPRRRRMSVITTRQVLVKGAPDSVVARCAATATEDLDGIVAEMTGRGLRVLAVATRTRASGEPDDAEAVESDLELRGLLGFADPPRPSAAAAVAACRRAGVAVAMITGDHPATARAIAEQIGLRVPDAPVLTGSDLPGDDESLGRLVDHDGLVLARATPEDKLRVARALQGRGHVVAMTGDGVNDGPALREADIGVAMGNSGTDVAREAADLVLLDDDFATIVAAIAQGRATFSNARQFLTYHLADNVAEITPFLVWALSGDRFPLALGVLQILALDLGTDTLSAAALGAEPPADDVLDHPPVSGRLLDRRVGRRAFAWLGPIEAAFGMLAFVASSWAQGWRPGEPWPTGPALAAASGAVFVTVILAQTANAFACRSALAPAWRRPWRENPYLVVAATLEVAFGAVALFVAPLARLLDHASPPLVGWLVAAASIPSVLLADAFAKRVRG